ncbi:MAG: STAS/SEC14 domain-containing protein [Chloroflexi bacterium]|nr:STAS/SEC14 domain-containing protein [Chloroflexota bacterium]
MLKELPGMPAGVIGFEVSGTVRAEDYRDVVIPALERAAREGDVRFVVEMPEFTGMTPSAMWQDLKVASEYLRAMKRIAIVTDLEWVAHMAALFGWLVPSEMRSFSMAQREDALRWITS